MKKRAAILGALTVLLAANWAFARSAAAQTAAPPDASAEASRKPAPVQDAAPVANKQAVLTQAHNSYYNLRNEGMQSFQCSMIPNWGALLETQRKENPDAADRAIKLLGNLHFAAAVGDDNKIKITHNELTDQTDQTKAALKQIYDGMEQMVSGFFDTWALFTLASPFPEAISEYQLTDANSQYHLNYHDGDAQVATMMGSDFAISSIHVNTAQYRSTLEPLFTRSPKGFLLSAYQADYEDNNPAEATKLKILIGYQDVQGLQILQSLDLSGSYGGSPFAVQLSFTDCQAAKKNASAQSQ
jgi:hypothetical protein